ncbi:MAG: hypothetical protein Q4D07_04215 [Selenomonadaceae bacterium]|nr:hypothetical protein [Selenomonadaceae bacterium]
MIKLIRFLAGRMTSVHSNYHGPLDTFEPRPYGQPGPLPIGGFGRLID